MLTRLKIILTVAAGLATGLVFSGCGPEEAPVRRNPDVRFLPQPTPLANRPGGNQVREANTPGVGNQPREANAPGESNQPSGYNAPGAGNQPGGAGNSGQ